jgi:ADP-heptose:LPS heptosyltransferase
MKIAVVRALYLGDMICAVPALRALRQKFPKAEITLIGLAWEKELVERFREYLDDFIRFPGWPGLPEQEINPKRIVNFLKRMQQEQWDLAIQMQGNGSYINSMVELFGAKKIWGFGIGMKYPNKGTEVERLLKLVGGGSTRLEWPILVHDRLNVPLEHYHYVIIHPGAKDPKRRWGVKQFARLAAIVQEKGYQVVLTGVRSELRVVKRLEQLMRRPVINLVGKTTLGSLGMLVRRSKLVISNDTGVAHLAAALNVPSVVISLSAEWERWLPLNHELHRVVRGNQIEAEQATRLGLAYFA